jgi:predicted phage-related endonuclease
VKWCGDVETRLEAAKQHALSQTSSIDVLFRTIDEISAEARRVRLEVDKLVKARKESIREEIVHAARRRCRSTPRRWPASARRRR